jgi:GntR family transcriptional regulator, transcriptional repressor for pyruvate dehydrogenase complex
MEKPTKFNKALQSRNALSTEIANRLCLMIREEQKPAGTILGTEAMLAKQFGVSRTAIREAIGQLRGLGIVESRQGLGLCVANGDAINTIAKVLAPMAGDKVSWSKLCHMRFVLEVGSIPLAVERITANQIERMRKLAEEMHALVKRKRPISIVLEEKIARHEIEFHQIIFDAAGCEFTEQIHSLLGEYFYESSGDGPYRSIPTIKDMEDHIKLVNAIAERDVGKTVAVMVDHIRHILSDESK